MNLSDVIRCSVFFLIAIPPSALRADGRNDPTPRLYLPVTEIRENYAPYASFCDRHPSSCDLSGPHLVDFSLDILQLLASANAEVNRAIDCRMSDKELFDLEEYWAFPSDELGDCEDIALFKRERLVELGLPRGAITIAIVHHRVNMMSHAVLLVETTAGTYLLDMFTDDIVLWHKAPYNFEARERPDGSWERFDQSTWFYD